MCTLDPNNIEPTGAPNPLDRQIEMQDCRLINGVWLAHQLTVTDQKNHRKTIAQLQMVVVNESIPSETFTLNTLENP